MEDNPRITYTLMAPKPSSEELQSAHTKKSDWYVEDTLLDDRLSYTKKFKVYAKVTKKGLIPKGTKFIDSETWEFVGIAKGD